MKTRWILLLFVLAFALGSCSPSQAGESQDLPQQESQPTQSQVPLPNPNQQQAPDITSVPVEKFVDLAKKDLASTLNINNDQITLLNSIEMTWPNSALGCPEPGKGYSQSQVPGYRIWLEAGGVEYIYHADLSGQVILCPTMNPDDSSTSTQEPEIGVPIK